MEVGKAKGRSICDPIRQPIPNPYPKAVDDEAARRQKAKGAMAKTKTSAQFG